MVKYQRFIKGNNYIISSCRQVLRISKKKYNAATFFYGEVSNDNRLFSKTYFYNKIFCFYSLDHTIDEKGGSMSGESDETVIVDVQINKKTGTIYMMMCISTCTITFREQRKFVCDQFVIIKMIFDVHYTLDRHIDKYQKITKKIYILRITNVVNPISYHYCLYYLSFSLNINPKNLKKKLKQVLSYLLSSLSPNFVVSGQCYVRIDFLKVGQHS